MNITKTQPKKFPPIPRPKSGKYRKISENIGKLFLGNSQKAEIEPKNSTSSGGVKGDYDEKKFRISIK